MTKEKLIYAPQEVPLGHKALGDCQGRNYTGSMLSV